MPFGAFLFIGSAVPRVLLFIIGGCGCASILPGAQAPADQAGLRAVKSGIGPDKASRPFLRVVGHGLAVRLAWTFARPFGAIQSWTERR